jgi:hypothetical protein
LPKSPELPKIDNYRWMNADRQRIEIAVSVFF